jgi:hypothetical protein
VNWMHMMHSCGIPITPAEDSIKAWSNLQTRKQQVRLFFQHF